MFTFQVTLFFKQFIPLYATPKTSLPSVIKQKKLNTEVDIIRYKWLKKKPFFLYPLKDSIRLFYLNSDLNIPSELRIKFNINRPAPYNFKEFFINKFNRHGKKKKFTNLFINAYHSFFWSLDFAVKKNSFPAYFEQQLILFLKSNLLMFHYRLERLPKLIKKFSRIRGAAFVTIWKYLHVFRRKKWLMNEIFKFIYEQPGLTLITLFFNFWQSFFDGIFLRHIKKKFFLWTIILLKIIINQLAY